MHSRMLKKNCEEFLPSLIITFCVYLQQGLSFKASLIIKYIVSSVELKSNMGYFVKPTSYYQRVELI